MFLAPANVLRTVEFTGAVGVGVYVGVFRCVDGSEGQTGLENTSSIRTVLAGLALPPGRGLAERRLGWRLPPYGLLK